MRIPARSFIFAVLLLALSARLRADTPIHGTVTTNDGHPVVGATVYGSRICCPLKEDETTTGEDGQYHLEHPGTVVHFAKEKLQSRTVVIRSGMSVVDVTLQPWSNPLLVRACEKPPPGIKRIGWGKYGLQFDVPAKGLEILGGKPDVDYVRYVIRRKHEKAFLQFWFGPYAMNPDPEDRQFVDSDTFQERVVIRPGDREAGLDSSGQLHDGSYWRQTRVGLEGARYSGASAEDAKIFDQIIDSLCEVPYPSQRSATPLTRSPSK